MRYEQGCFDYVAYMRSRGVTSDEIRAQLLDLGWHPESINQALYAKPDGKQRRRCDIGPDLTGLPNRIEFEGKSYPLAMRIRHPDVCLLGGVLSSAECLDLIRQATPQLDRSRVFVRASGEKGATSYARTSYQASFPYGSAPWIDVIYERCAALTRWPVEQMESMHVVRYGPGGDFGPHYDYFSVNAGVERTRQRVATLLLYLNNPPNGGATSFPDIELDIFPQEGNMLYFSYLGASSDTKTLHAGVPLGSGEKWIATLFLTKPIDHDEASRRGATS